jgi:hypothetical protein
LEDLTQFTLLCQYRIPGNAHFERMTPFASLWNVGSDRRPAIRLEKLSSRFLPPNLKNPGQTHYRPGVAGKGTKLGHDSINLHLRRQACLDNGFPNMHWSGFVVIRLIPRLLERQRMPASASGDDLCKLDSCN